MALNDVQEKLEQFSALLDKFESSASDRNQMMTLRKGLLEDLQETLFENEAQKEEIWDRYRGLASKFRDKIEQTNLEFTSFAEEANRRVTNLEQNINAIVVDDKPAKEAFTALRQETESVFEFIKQNNWPSKESRTTTWEQFNSLREQLRTKENDFYEKLKEERERKSIQSTAFTNILLEAIEACKIELPADQSVEALGTFLAKAKELKLNIPSVETRSKEEALKVPLKTQTEILRDLRKVANENRDLFVWDDRQKVYNAFDELKAALDLSWENYKQELQKKRDEREQKKVEWERKQREFLTMMEGKLEKQIVYKEKLENFGTGQQDFVVRLENRLSNQQEYLLKLHDDLDELQAQYDAAWSAGFKERMQSRILQKKEKIISVEQDIQSSQNKLKEVEDNVKQFPSRLLEAEQTIEEIQSKIIEVKQKLNIEAEATE